MRRDIPSATVEKWRKLFALIVSLTDKNLLKWSETANDAEYIASYVDASFLVSKKFRRNSDGRPVNFIEVRIQDAEGREIDSFNDEDLSGDGNSLEYFVRMNEFLKQLQRKVSGAEQFLDMLITSMEKRDDDIPF